MDPTDRRLRKGSIEDAILADSTSSELMGEDVKTRKEFIGINAKYVKNLDAFINLYLSEFSVSVQTNIKI